MNNKFEVHKLKREIKRSGAEFEIYRAVANDYGEPSGELELLGHIKGLYHETNSHIAVSMAGTTQVRTKKVPSILCLYEDVAELGVRVGDTVMINNTTLKVAGTINIQEWNLIADISLEVVDRGI